MKGNSSPRPHSPVLNTNPVQLGGNTIMPNMAQEKPFTPTVPIMRKMQNKTNPMILVVAAVLVIAAGVGTGWMLSGANASSKGSANVSTQQKDVMKQSDNEAGIDDSEAFPDTATGTLVKGGIEGEGQYHLERTGGPSQNVYLTSTVIDLASFEGKKVEVKGQTLSGKKAGWLMDVGRVKVVE